MELGTRPSAALTSSTSSSEPYPTPLVGKDPAGSLIYDPSVTGSIGFVGDTDTYTLPLAAGQTLSLVYTTGSGLTGTVTLLDPNNKVIGTATGSGPGATVVLETAPITTAGTYSLVASGSGGTTGNYTLQAILNATYKQATDSINTIGTAYNLASAFASLGTTPAADRAGVIGVLSSSPDYYAVPLAAGEAASIAVKGSGGAASIALYDGTGKQLALSTAGGGVDGIISDFVAPSKGTYYVQVTGAASLTYDLVVTRGSDFTIHGNSFNNAQPLDGASVVSGASSRAIRPRLQALDLQANAYSNIYQTDPVTGAFGSQITSPNNDGFYPLRPEHGLRRELHLFQRRLRRHRHDLQAGLDRSRGRLDHRPNSDLYGGLAYLNGKLYADCSRSTRTFTSTMPTRWRFWERSTPAAPFPGRGWPATPIAACSGGWRRASRARLPRSIPLPGRFSRQARTTTRDRTSKTSRMPTASLSSRRSQAPPGRSS